MNTLTQLNELSEQPCSTYSDLCAAVAAIKRGETKFSGTVNLAVDLNELGYDCQLNGDLIIVSGYETTDNHGNIVRVNLLKRASTHIGFSEYRDGKHYFYNGNFEPTAEGTVQEVTAFLQSLKTESQEEGIQWEGGNGTYFTGLAANAELEKEIAALNDGTHTCFREE